MHVKMHLQKYICKSTNLPLLHLGSEKNLLNIMIKFLFAWSVTWIFLDSLLIWLSKNYFSLNLKEITSFWVFRTEIQKDLLYSPRKMLLPLLRGWRGELQNMKVDFHVKSTIYPSSPDLCAVVQIHLCL